MDLSNNANIAIQYTFPCVSSDLDDSVIVSLTARFEVETGPKVIKHLSCSAQLRINFFPAHKC